MMRYKFAFLISIIFCVIIPSADAQTTSFFKTYTNGADTSYVFEGVAESNNGFYIAVGYKVYCIEDPIKCFGDGYIVKVDNYGNKIWEKSYAYKDGEDLEYYAIEKAQDGSGYVICGLTQTAPGSELDFYICKIDEDGNILWEQNYGSSTYRDWAYDIKNAPDGGYVICGWSGENNHDISIMKIDETGTLIWKNVYGTESGEYGYSTSVTSTNAILTAGSSGGLEPGGYIVKTNVDGDTIWTKIYDDIYQIRNIESEEYGSFTITGYAKEPYSNSFLAKCDSNGTVLWFEKYLEANQSWAFDHKKVEDDGYILATISSNSLDYDFNIIRTDLNGEIMWETRANGAIDYSKSIICTSDSGFLLCGNSSNQATLLKIGSSGQIPPFMSSVGEDPLLRSFMIFPNPTSELINLIYDAQLRINEIQIWDMSGRLIQSFDPKEKQLNVSNLPSGTYILSIQSDQGTLNKKFVTL